LGGERRINYALDRLKSALHACGNPEGSVHSLIVSGTNGKGTTALYVSAGLVRAGFRVATYLSPHLQEPNERILTDLVPIEESRLTELAQEFYPVAKKFGLTYFEYLTLLNFVHAREAGVDFLILEVGLGGRLDATNVADPLAAILTNVGFDHQSYLGNTLEEILSEKLGVLRGESLLFTGETKPALLTQIENYCNELDSIYYYSKEIPTSVHQIDFGGQSVRISGFPFRLTNPSRGTLANAALALLALRIVFPRIPVSTFQSAFAEVVTPGRMEIINEGPRIILSGDHNPAGMDCLETTLRDLNVERLHTLCAFSPDKPFAQLHDRLSKLSTTTTVTEIGRLAGTLPPEYYQMGNFSPDAVKTLERLLAQADREDTILVTGSLYLVGEVRKLWRKSVRFWKEFPTTSDTKTRLPDRSNRPIFRPSVTERNPALGT